MPKPDMLKLDLDGPKETISLNLKKSVKSQRSSLWSAAVLFIVVSALLIAVDQLSLRFGLDGSRRIADDLFGGLVAASIFHLYERQRLRRFNQQLHTIDLINQHIRNVLQPLVFATQGAEPDGQMMVEECVRHIDWALREGLPGEPHHHSAPFFNWWLDTWRGRNEKAS
jgi:hypothetical protein